MVWIWEHLRVPGGTIIYTQLAACSNILLLIVVLGPVFDTANDDADCFADANYHN